MTNPIPRARFPRTLIAAVVLLGAVMPRGGLAGQVEERPAADVRAGRLDEMGRIVRPLKASRIEGDRRVPVALRPEPLHRWNDPTRDSSDGSLWAWGTTGRPVAAVALELFRGHERGPFWSVELVSTSTGLVEVEGGAELEGESFPPPRPDGTAWWAPKTPGLEFHDIPSAPAPAGGEAERLRQIKGLLSRFTAAEYYGATGQTYPLRLLPRPVLRYADGPGGLIDGALFLFVHGTNPEILLFIEAQGPDPAHASWRFGLAQLTRAAPTVELDRKAVWTRPTKAQLSFDEPYYAMRKFRPNPDDDPKPGVGEKP